MVNMKKRITAFLAAGAIALLQTASLAAGVIPDHRGTDMTNIEIGTESLGKAVKSYSALFKEAGDRYGVDPNLLAAICMQESSGRNLSYREDGTEYPAWGIMQIEKTNEKLFAAFGKKTDGVAWTLEDRLDERKSVAFAAHLISKALIRYDCDYMKMIQAYNFGETVLDRIIEAHSEDWLDERKNAKDYATDWKYDSYGDALYIEHVMRYYHNDIDYIGAKVRLGGKLIDFEDQFPIIEDGRTLIPIRAVSELLGAEVEWNADWYQAEISKDGTEIILPVNSDTAYIDGGACELDVPAKIINGRTMVPLRFIADAFDTFIDWEPSDRTVLIESY